jgi:hypothetical protein
MSLLPNPDNLWFFIAVIAACLVWGCLRTIGFEYYNAVLWHNLKIEVQNLQIEQKRRLRELERQEAAPVRVVAPAPVEEQATLPTAGQPEATAEEVEIQPVKEAPAPEAEPVAAGV